ncbi:GspH/FimT family pseudopilin [Pseudoalteromonas sp. G4]|uniref:GspH/FimT family pseudopilin n=1 Tax=Pseudoalteromonas sp. G4 TaxID=2992761 RepID=UPI00237DA68F|nr:GspH/FimT family pseudopilin [Pseudoalteromonas sp. G4]MDE3273482.1 GspH/FimT family pseudopilin [Pseudoalteromonas sp. G4]
MKQKLFGFTLVEILAVFLLLGVLSTIVLPNLSRLLAQNNLDNAISKIFKSLSLARGYAVTHSTNITVCPLISGSCSDDWQSDIYTFEDNNANLSLDDEEYVVSIIERINPRNELSYPRNAITYRADGSIKFMQSGSFLYCHHSYLDLKGNQITVSQVGRVRVRDSNKCETPNL